jgi:drug/metabolite transporter (DMT)-like permease
VIYLILAAFILSYFFVCFRLFDRFGVDTFTAIVINYAVCVPTGLAYCYYAGLDLSFDGIEKWWPLAVGLGFVFIGSFQLMALCSQRISVSVAAVASKTSMIAPILYSLFVTRQGTLNAFSLMGIVLAFSAVFLTTMKRKSGGGVRKRQWLLVAGTFTGSAMFDFIMNYSNYTYADKVDNFQNQFSLTAFAAATIFGSVYLIVTRKFKLNKKSLFAGFALGIPNYFSIILILMALSSLNNNGAFVFPALNVGVIVLSAIASVVIFREKLSTWNLAGLAAAIGGMVLLGL